MIKLSLNRLFISSLIIAVSSAFLLPTSSIAKRGKFPHGCEAVGFTYQGEMIELNAINEDKPEIPQTVFLFHNKTNRTIHLQYQEPEEMLVSPNWQTTIKPNRWTGFATDHKKIHFSCHYYSRRSGLSPADCQEVLELCQYPRAKFSEGNIGNYWISENRSRNQAVRDAIRTGILLRW